MVLRKCIGCGEIKQRDHLIRIMKDHKSHEILIKPDSKHFGYSVYLCYNNSCLKNVLRKKKLQKFLGPNFSDEKIDCIKSLIDKK